MTRLTPISLIAGAMLALASLGAHAADDAKPKKELTPQQQRMSDCSKQSKGMAKDEKSGFMSACLKGEAASGAGKTMTPQQQRMSDCSKQSKGMAKTEKNSFMSTCLKGEPAAAASAPAKKASGK